MTLKLHSNSSSSQQTCDRAGFRACCSVIDLLQAEWTSTPQKVNLFAKDVFEPAVLGHSEVKVRFIVKMFFLTGASA